MQCPTATFIAHITYHSQLSVPDGVHRQLGCEKKEDDDVLRPYSHLNYAWDEPSLPHKLVLSLPGNLVLGTFKLDEVCSSRRHKCLPDHFLLGTTKCASSILRLHTYWLSKDHNALCRLGGPRW